jgi:hypothetical protein
MCSGKISDKYAHTATLRNVCIEPTKITTSARITHGRAGLSMASVIVCTVLGAVYLLVG